MDYNPYIIVPLATWAIAQIAKFALAAFKGRLDFRYLYASGGMPSVHSAVVTSLAITAFLVDGASSHLFGFTAIFAAVVMYDSFGVRRSAGEQAAAINMLIQSLEQGRIKLDQPTLKLREVLGHQPLEVAVGAALGAVLAGLFNYDRLEGFTSWLQEVPVGRELWAYAALFGVLVVGGFVQRFWLRRRARRSGAMSRVVRHVLVATQTVGWLGVLAAWLAYENASYGAWRLWSLLLMAAAVVWVLIIAGRVAGTVPAELEREAAQERQQRWLGVGKKRKNKLKRK